MDVWFDSGSSWAGVVEAREDLVYPADLYLEGEADVEVLFNSSVARSLGLFR